MRSRARVRLVATLATVLTLVCLSASAGARDADWEPDTNFRRYLSGGEGLIDTRLLPYRERDDDGYFSLLFAPVIELDESVPRDVVLVLDRSGSMEGDKMAQATASAYLQYAAD